VKVLLLHGWPVSERIWVSQVSALRDAGFDPVAPHLYELFDDHRTHAADDTGIAAPAGAVIGFGGAHA